MWSKQEVLEYQTEMFGFEEVTVMTLRSFPPETL